MRTILNAKIWPHTISFRWAVLVASLLLVLQLVGQITASYLDDTLVMEGDAVGLLEHPGIFSIIIGDFLLFLLTTYCSQAFFQVGKKIPSTHPALVARYFAVVQLQNWFGSPGGFLKLFVFLSFIGLMALVNQSLALEEPVEFYGHDTFTSQLHERGFWFSRLNLLISWCYTIPLFSAYLISYALSTNTLFQIVGKKGILAFHFCHRDRAGGFAFFGTLNMLYMIGLLVVLLEIILLIYTHRQVSLTNLLSMAGLTVGFVGFSHFSVFQVSQALISVENKLKSDDFRRFGGDQNQIDAYHLALHHNVRFSLYNTVTEKVLLAMRLTAAVPTIYKLLQYSKVIA